MSNKSLTYRLGLYISCAVLLVFSIFVFWTFKFHITYATKSEESRAIAKNSEIHRMVRDIVVLTQQITLNVARQIDFYHRHGGTEILLTDILKEYDYLQSIEVKLTKVNGTQSDFIYIAARSGDKIVFDKGKNPGYFCINEDTLRHYFSDLTKTGWSEPFRSVKKNDNIDVFNDHFEIRDSFGNIQTSGNIKCEISLSCLQNLINQEMTDSTKMWKNGYAFLVSPNGTYMTYPLQEYILKRNVKASFTNRIIRDSVKLIKFMKAESGPVVVYPPALNYARAWSYPSLIAENNWLLVTTIPYSELHHDLYLLLIKQIIILLFFVVAIFFLVFSISGRIMQPISEISKELHNFSIEFLDHKLKPNNETVALRESLVRLQERYEQQKQNEAESSRRRGRYLADLALASEIQQSLIPPTGIYTSQNTGISIYSVFRPAQLISGDLYDFFMIDSQRLLITIGDVSGGGIPAALFMGIAHSYIRSYSSGKNTKDIVNQVNKKLCINNANQFFLTLFIGILDIRKGILNYCNAGHAPTFLFSASGNVKALSDHHGLPLGLYPDRNYLDTTIQILKGDSIILYTDGITDHINETGQFYGVDSFYKLFDQMKGMSPEEMSVLIMKSIDDFGGDVSQPDDLSLMVLKYS